MKNKNTLLIAAALLFCFEGCSSDTDSDIPGEDSASDQDIEVLMELNATINSYITRVAESSWASNDAIGVTVDSDINIKYATTNDGAFSAVNANNSIYLRSAIAKNISAYYPYTGVDHTSPGTIQFTADASAQSDQASIDFLFAQGSIIASNPITDLKFDHKMSKVTFYFEAAEGAEKSDLSFSLYNVYTGGTFNTESGSISPTVIGNIKDVEVKLPLFGDMESTLILIPQILENVKIELCINNLYYEANYDFTFYNGFADSYIITIPKDPGAQLIILAGSQSGQWTSGGNTNIISD